ncbi:Ig-like domain-containing protein [Paenibacillus sp. LPE1-1-1.1]|uniref:Ig-like domain-containing protein n=1 Tax=Paenibacillus sp. LPE1-1-1.1 TaxID=3135230 RepID=UPI0034477A8A
MELQGKKLNLYRSLSGNLIYNFIDNEVNKEDPFVSSTSGLRPLAGGEPIVAMRPIEDPDPDPDPEPIPIDLSVEITSPAAGATINGPFAGASFNITGTAVVSSGGGSIKKVEVQVGNGAFQTAALTGGTWTLANVVVTTAGALKLAARATHSGGTTSLRQINVNVALAPQPDTQLPAVQILSPAAGQILPGTGSTVSIKVEGTASDNKLLTKVELSVDGGAPMLTEAGNGWANWSKTITLAAGSHTLVAKATDGNNNTNNHSLTFSVDTIAPKITISKPLGNTEITGSELQGAMIEVTGTAQDENGIRKVELSLGLSPVWIEVQPKAPGDWSEWNGFLLVKEPGLQTVHAMTTDKAGNTAATTVAVKVVIIPEVISRLKRLIIVEQYQLSSYLGNYGAGRTLKTFSLLPGEKSKISVRSYTQSETTSKSASSVVDSFTDESAIDLEKSMANEQSNRKGYEESFKYKVSAEAKASWGFGSASINGEVSGGTNGAREEFAKNMSNAVQKHVAKASSNRDMQVNTSYETKTSSSEETAIVREIENINVGRTLNFVFRQMNQEFITLLHLTDIRIGFFSVDMVNGKEVPAYREVTLPQLDALLNDTIVPNNGRLSVSPFCISWLMCSIIRIGIIPLLRISS